MENLEGETLKVILFKLGNETYGVPIDQVISIERVQSLTRVPNVADFVVAGIMNLRGLIVPVLDMRRRFNMGVVEQSKDSRIIIVEMEEMTVGLMVDAAKEVLDISKGNIEQTPDIVGGPEVEYIKGVAKMDNDELLILLNLKRVLNNEEIEEMKSIEV
ncbi:chemotaxis protein CheW [Terrilactibacillus sp. S3-3]|nr:chemotaxis protein CheW [Terrilactibacillus sp. S3-3]